MRYLAPWLWVPPQDEAFEKLKTELTEPTLLTLYDPEATLKISADASAFRLGAVLLQLRKGGRRKMKGKIEEERKRKRGLHGDTLCGSPTVL